MNQVQDQTKFWDQKAKDFPRYEEGENTYEAGMLRRMREHGVDFTGKTVLDVGCGSGMYTIRLAQQARHVTAVDISQGMLDALREDAVGQGLDNIETIHSEWMDFPDGTTYDIVFCSMTPAVNDEESRMKVLNHVGRWLVFMGFDGLMHNDIVAGLLDYYDVPRKPFDNGTRMRAWLDGRGIRYHRSSVEGQWVTEKPRDEMLERMATWLIPHGVTPEPGHLERHMEQFRTDHGTYVETTDYRIDLLVWEK